MHRRKVFSDTCKEEIDISACITNEDVKKVIDDWIDYYNTNGT
jgi:hypothetical protein